MPSNSITILSNQASHQSLVHLNLFMNGPENIGPFT
jgi:hypothetical protein